MDLSKKHQLQKNALLVVEIVTLQKQIRICVNNAQHKTVKYAKMIFVLNVNQPTHTSKKINQYVYQIVQVMDTNKKLPLQNNVCKAVEKEIMPTLVKINVYNVQPVIVKYVITISVPNVNLLTLTLKKINPFV